MSCFRLERTVAGLLLLREGADFSRGFVQGENRRLRWGEDRTVHTEYPLKESWAQAGKKKQGQFNRQEDMRGTEKGDWIISGSQPVRPCMAF